MRERRANAGDDRRPRRLPHWGSARAMRLPGNAVGPRPRDGILPALKHREGLPPEGGFRPGKEVRPARTKHPCGTQCLTEGGERAAGCRFARTSQPLATRPASVGGTLGRTADACPFPWPPHGSDLRRAGRPVALRAPPPGAWRVSSRSPGIHPRKGPAPTFSIAPGARARTFQEGTSPLWGGRRRGGESVSRPSCPSCPYPPGATPVGAEDGRRACRGGNLPTGSPIQVRHYGRGANALSGATCWWYVTNPLGFR